MSNFVERRLAVLFAFAALVATTGAQQADAGLLAKLKAKFSCCEPSCCEPVVEESCCEPVEEVVEDCGCAGEVMSGEVIVESSSEPMLIEASPSEEPTPADPAPEPPTEEPVDSEPPMEAATEPEAPAEPMTEPMTEKEKKIEEMKKEAVEAVRKAAQEV